MSFYLILHDVSKRKNIGTLVRSATAFGCSGILAAKKKNQISMFGAHGADKFIPFIYCEDPFEYARKELKCSIVGVEIHETAVSVRSPKAFNDAECVAFILGNEGTGMHPAVAAKCDRFVYVPQFGNGTASLNIAVAGSIVFHEYASQMQFKQHPINGQKFIVDPRTSF